MLCTSGFMDDVTFGRSGPYGDARKAEPLTYYHSRRCDTGAESDVYGWLVFDSSPVANKPTYFLAQENNTMREMHYSMTSDCYLSNTSIRKPFSELIVWGILLTVFYLSKCTQKLKACLYKALAVSFCPGRMVACRPYFNHGGRSRFKFRPRSNGVLALRVTPQLYHSTHVQGGPKNRTVFRSL